MFSDAVRGSRVNFSGAVAAVATLALAGCGGGARQDAHEPSGNFSLSVLHASFPAHQRLSQSARMSITVRNDDTRAIPDLAVTVNSFSYVSSHPGLADPNRPVWIVDQGPSGGQSAYVNTWTGGSLAPGQTHTFTWNLTAVLPGRHHISWRLAAGLNGRARAHAPGGGIPQGAFDVDVSSLPAQTTVNPDTGQVVPAPGAVQGNAPSGTGSGAGGPPAVSHGTQGPNDTQPGTGSGASPDAGAGAQSSR